MQNAGCAFNQAADFFDSPANILAMFEVAFSNRWSRTNLLTEFFNWLEKPVGLIEKLLDMITLNNLGPSLHIVSVVSMVS